MAEIGEGDLRNLQRERVRKALASPWPRKHGDECPICHDRVEYDRRQSDTLWVVLWCSACGYGWRWRRTHVA